jgi:hypothetical protein
VRSSITWVEIGLLRQEAIENVDQFRPLRGLRLGVCQRRAPRDMEPGDVVTLCVPCAPTLSWANHSNEVKELLMLPYVVGIVLSIGVWGPKILQGS